MVKGLLLADKSSPFGNRESHFSARVVRKWLIDREIGENKNPCVFPDKV